jgi:hypothetical protein
MVMDWNFSCRESLKGDAPCTCHFELAGSGRAVLLTDERRLPRALVIANIIVMACNSSRVEPCNSSDRVSLRVGTTATIDAGTLVDKHRF